MRKEKDSKLREAFGDGMDEEGKAPAVWKSQSPESIGVGLDEKGKNSGGMKERRREFSGAVLDEEGKNFGGMGEEMQEFSGAVLDEEGKSFGGMGEEMQEFSGAVLNEKGKSFGGMGKEMQEFSGAVLNEEGKGFGGMKERMPEFFGAVLDMDGTLLDSMGVWSEADRIFLDSVDRKPKPDLAEKVGIMTVPEAAVYFKEQYRLSETAAEIEDRIHKIVEDAYVTSIGEKPGVTEFLKLLKEKGVKMCVATATERDLAEAALKRCGLDVFFEFIITCKEAGIGKTRPDIFREACRRLGVVKEKMIVIEDAAYALETAKKDGFFTIGIFEECAVDKEAAKKAADIYVKDFFELAKILKKG